MSSNCSKTEAEKCETQGKKEIFHFVQVCSNLLQKWKKREKFLAFGEDFRKLGSFLNTFRNQTSSFYSKLKLCFFLQDSSEKS